MKYLILVLALSPVCSCGGGGGGAGGGAGGGGGGGQTAADALQVLEACQIADLNDLLDLLELFTSLLDQGVAPGLNIDAIDPAGGTFSFSIDTDGDLAPDVFGDASFLDATGIPGAPFDLLQLQLGIGNLPNLLMAMPDGAQVVINLQIPGTDSAIIMAITYTFLSGVINDIGANANTVAPTCTADLTFAGAALSNFAGQVPTLVMDMVATGEGQVSGTITLDGTNIARIEANLDGLADFTFDLDLTTGLLTEVP